MNILTGNVYLIEEELLEKPSLKVAKEEQYEIFQITRAILVQNHEYNNIRLKFDIAENSDAYGALFTGFLYNDGTVSGKLKWMKISRPEEFLNGKYRWVSKTKLHLYGIWSEQSGARDGFFIELVSSKKSNA